MGRGRSRPGQGGRGIARQLARLHLYPGRSPHQHLFADPRAEQAGSWVGLEQRDADVGAVHRNLRWRHAVGHSRGRVGFGARQRMQQRLAHGVGGWARGSCGQDLLEDLIGAVGNADRRRWLLSGQGDRRGVHRAVDPVRAVDDAVEAELGAVAGRHRVRGEDAAPLTLEVDQEDQTAERLVELAGIGLLDPDDGEPTVLRGVVALAALA